MTPERFAAITAEHEQVMYRMAYLYTKNESDALDAVQEACCRAYQHIDRLKKPEYIRTWLVRITINCAVDMLRRQGRERSLPPESMDGLAGISPSAEREIIEKAALEQLMEALTAEEKQAVMLKYYCGCTFAEMAETLSRPLGSVKTTIYRALEKLRKKAAEDEIYAEKY